VAYALLDEMKMIELRWL